MNNAFYLDTIFKLFFHSRFTNVRRDSHLFYRVTQPEEVIQLYILSVYR